MRDSFERFASLPSGALDYLYNDVLERLIPERSDEDEMLLQILGFIAVSYEPLRRMRDWACLVLRCCVAAETVQEQKGRWNLKPCRRWLQSQTSEPEYASIRLARPS